MSAISSNPPSPLSIEFPQDPDDMPPLDLGSPISIPMPGEFDDMPPLDLGSPISAFVPAQEVFDDAAFSAAPAQSFPFSLNIESLLGVCGDANQVVVYGGKDCLYEAVAQAIADLTIFDHFPIRKVFNYGIGIWSNEAANTLEGERIDVLKYEIGSDRDTLARVCKTGITNLVLVNYMRKREGLRVIPLLFCIDIDGNPNPFTPERITSKDPNDTSITLMELRRAFKLWTLDNPFVHQVVEETLKFVKLQEYDGQYYLQRIAAPWADPHFKECWAARQLTQKDPKGEEYDWKYQFISEIIRYERQFSVVSREVSADEDAVLPSVAKGTKRKAEAVEAPLPEAVKKMRAAEPSTPRPLSLEDETMAVPLTSEQQATVALLEMELFTSN